MIYAKDASPTFNTRLDGALRRLADDVRHALGDDLLALILGGGYGRGEGGVVTVAGEERPYSDLDLFLLTRSGRPLGDKLAAVAERAERELGVEVDFSRPLTLADVRRWPPRLMWRELLDGHVVLSGPDDILTANAPESLQRPLPAIEATCLLLNRGACLLWAWRVARDVEPAPDADFVRRNDFKLRLALGDALLIAHGRHATAYAGRDALLAQTPRNPTPTEDRRCAAADCGDANRKPDPAKAGEEAVHVPGTRPIDLVYAEALRFKFTPDAFPPEAPGEARLGESASLWGKVFLHVENVRLDRAWSDLDAYCRWPGPRESEMNTLACLPKNLILNLRLGRLGRRYPRERLYPWLPRLLGLARPEPDDWNADSERFLALWRGFD